MDIGEQFGRFENVLSRDIDAWQREEIGRGDEPLTGGTDDSKAGTESYKRRSGVRGMNDIAWASTEDGIELVLAEPRKTPVTAVLVTGKVLSEVPTPRSLTDIASNCPDVPNLRCSRRPRRFGKDPVFAANKRMSAELCKSHETTNANAISLYLYSIETSAIPESIEVDEYFCWRQIILEHPQQISASPDNRCTRAVGFKARDRLDQGRRIDIGQTPHAKTSTTRVRVIGSSLIRRPVALKKAFPMAATTGMTGGSPTFFALYGPKVSIGSRK